MVSDADATNPSWTMTEPAGAMLRIVMDDSSDHHEMVSLPSEPLSTFVP
jgi:hypothetical protein